MGVDVFFVLSGFLITSILLAEYEKRGGKVSFKAFYARRALRLFPALAVLIIVAGLAGVTLSEKSWSHPTLLGLPWVILYVGNWNIVIYGGAYPLGALGQTWSLAIEEQFYIVWPWLLIFLAHRVRSRIRVAQILLVLAIADMAYRFLAIEALGWDPRDRIYFGSDTHCDGLLLGGALAFFIASRPLGQPFSKHILTATAVAAGASSVGLVLLVMRMSYVSPSGVWFGISAAVICTAVIVFNLVTEPIPLLRSILTCRPVQWIGRRSYAIYLWQETIAFLVLGVSHHGLSLDEFNALQVILTFVIAAFSYRLVELPFLRRKTSYARVSQLPSRL